MTRSERFREHISETYSALSPADLELIDEVCTTLDFLETLRAEVAKRPLVEIRQGGPRVSPLVVEERLRSQHLTSLLRRFPDLADDPKEDQ
jgi:hypothetical protein